MQCAGVGCMLPAAAPLPAHPINLPLALQAVGGAVPGRLGLRPAGHLPAALCVGTGSCLHSTPAGE